MVSYIANQVCPQRQHVMYIFRLNGHDGTPEEDCIPLT
jgi:hypothetical protein